MGIELKMGCVQLNNINNLRLFSVENLSYMSL